MQRAAFPELHGRPRPRRHRRQAEPDRVLIGLKIATFLAAAGLIGVIILLASAGGNGAAGRVPAQQRIGSGDDARPNEPAPTTPPTVIEPPAMRTETSYIAGTPPPPPPPPPKRPRPPTTSPDPQFAVIGERCPQRGMFYFTKDRQPVMCYSPTPNEPPTWRPVF